MSANNYTFIYLFILSHNALHCDRHAPRSPRPRPRSRRAWRPPLPCRAWIQPTPCPAVPSSPGNFIATAQLCSLGVWWLNGSAPNCHSAVPGSNPASLNLQEHMSVPCWGSQQGWHCNCWLASEVAAEAQKNIIIKKNNESYVALYWPASCDSPVLRRRETVPLKRSFKWRIAKNRFLLAWQSL